MLHLSHSSSRYTHMFSRYFVGSVSYRVFRYGMICITFLVTPRSRVLLEKLAGPQLVKKFPSFYGTRRFITALQVPTACPYLEPDQSSPYPTSHFLKIHLNIILPSTPGSPKWSISHRFPHQNPVCTFRSPNTCYVHCPSHSSLFDHRNNIWR